MIDPQRVLQPIEAQDFERRLRDYDGPDALKAAMADATAAVEATLRRLLRDDPSGPDDDRMSAMSTERLPFESLVERLRARDVLSLQLAGMIHQLRTEASAAAVRPPAADQALATLERLRREVRERADAGAAAPVASHAPSLPRPAPTEPRSTATGAAPARPRSGARLDEPVHAVPPPGRRRRLLLLVVVVAVIAAVAALATWWMRSDDGAGDAGARAFAAGDYPAAAQAYAARVREDPDDLNARLYLARSYRRLERYAEASEQIVAAAELAPSDPLVRREAGYLFMELGQPTAAVEQFQMAVEFDPESTAGWVGLIRAMSASNDSRVRETLTRAPADVRALFSDSIQ